MAGVLILTHGGLAPEFLAAARVISGDLESFEALALDWSDGVEEAHHKVGDALRRFDRDEGILILTDILGGTPFNVAMAFHDPGRVEVISGVNLPMVVRLGCLVTNDMPLCDLTTWIRDKGRSSIRSSKDVPRPVDQLEQCEESDDRA
ncbi:MAG: PTS fructose transporter subunit IIA [bacterium]|nr:PTS fructose transporter subunit IIA [bacterium]